MLISFIGKVVGMDEVFVDIIVKGKWFVVFFFGVKFYFGGMCDGLEYVF